MPSTKRRVKRGLAVGHGGQQAAAVAAAPRCFACGLSDVTKVTEITADKVSKSILEKLSSANDANNQKWIQFSLKEIKHHAMLIVS